MGRAMTGLLVTTCLAGATAGCDGGEAHRPWFLTVEAHWNDSPSTVDEIGYQLWADVLWPDRDKDCYALPANLQIHVGDQILTPMVQGDCSSEMLVFANGFQQGGAVNVSVRDGEQVLGEGVFDDLFPNVGVTVVTPAGGQPVKAGAPITIELPSAAANPTLAGARFYWTDTPADVPPYYTFASATIADDLMTFQTTAPSTTGHAVMDVKAFFPGGNFVPATSCSGFQYCDALPNWEDAGPVAIDVVP